MTYGNSLADMYRLVGVYVGRILKGEKPTNLPVVQSAKFEFVINMQTARALGIEVPNSMQLSPDADSCALSKPAHHPALESTPGATAAPWRAPVVRYFCGGAALQNSRWGRHASKDANLYTGTQRTLCS
jgi:ABC transporter substrate binding protein